jgi:hypothetical protein
MPVDRSHRVLAKTPGPTSPYSYMDFRARSSVLQSFGSAIAGYHWFTRSIATADCKRHSLETKKDQA